MVADRLRSATVGSREAFDTQLLVHTLEIDEGVDLDVAGRIERPDAHGGDGEDLVGDRIAKQGVASVPITVLSR